MKTLAIFALSAIALSAHANLIGNGDFSAGNTGFGTDYTYNATNLYPEGYYTVNSNPNNVHNLWSSFGDHTTGTGQMLVVNGAPTDLSVSTPRFWYQDVALAANTTYKLSFWAASTYPVEPANIALSFDNAVATSVTLGTTTGAWTRYSVDLHSVSAGLHNLAMVDYDTQRYGNDFAVDDIKMQAVPEPSAVAALGLGALGLLKRRKKA